LLYKKTIISTKQNSKYCLTWSHAVVLACLQRLLTSKLNKNGLNVFKRGANLLQNGILNFTFVG